MPLRRDDHGDVHMHVQLHAMEEEGRCIADEVYSRCIADEETVILLHAPSTCGRRINHDGERARQQT